jgi:DNA-binding response OmpR family regulator
MMNGTAFQLTILVVDPDEAALALLGQSLRRSGYACHLVSTFAQAYDYLAHNDVDLVIVDMHLPARSGLELLRWVRGRSAACEVILLTIQPSVETAIEALRHGAADYLAKPLSGAVLSEALLRVQTRLERQRPALAANAEGPHSGPYRAGLVVLHPEKFVIEVAGQPIDATPSEFEILLYLFRHAGRVVTAQEMVQSIRGYRVDAREAPEIIRPHISNLRRKLSAALAEADVVQTVRGVGYILRDQGG